MEQTNASNWETKAMPCESAHFMLGRAITDREWSILQKGHIPKDMDDRWFFYTEEDKVYFHRSWTGICIYIIKIETEADGTKTLTDVTVNQNKEQYKADLAESEKLLQTMLDRRLR